MTAQAEYKRRRTEAGLIRTEVICDAAAQERVSALARYWGISKNKAFNRCVEMASESILRDEP